MSEASGPGDFEVLQTIIAALKPFDKETQLRVLQSTITFLGLQADLFVGSRTVDLGRSTPATYPSSQGSLVEATERQGTQSDHFSNRPDISPKEFLIDKEPHTDVERVACLAYYLTHYRNIREFKTVDISKLNTESAQIKFSNPADAVENATRVGFLVPATKAGLKQLGAVGERFVVALPDREAAKAVRAKVRPRRTTKKFSRGASGEAKDAGESDTV